MVSHKRLSPGVEVNEIDRSAYDTTDYSITDTATFICGFADEGEDHVPTWINSMDTFRKRYGVPRNEMELYFKYAAQEIIGRGGTVVAAKLPYCNQKKDSFNAVRYTLGNLSAFSDDDVYGRRFSEIDATLTSMLTINSDVQPFRMTLDCFDKYRTNKMMFDRDTFVVVDITKGDYGSVYDEEDRECLGIIPVVATAGNAAFFQLMAGLSGDQWISDEDPSRLGEYQTPDLSAFQPLSEVRSCLSAGLFPPESMQRDLSLGFKFSDIKDGQRNFILSASSVNVESVSKTAAAEFPSLLQLAEDRLDRQYLKHICVAVFQAVKSQSDDSVEIRLIESFTGSLDKTSKSEETGASDYICDVVNGRSRFINVFANVDAKNGKYSKA